MSDQVSDSFKFFVEQVVRQYQELKFDIRTESSQLRNQLTDGAKAQADDLKEFKKDCDERFAQIEKNILDLQRFKWSIAGAAALAFALAEIGMRAFDYFVIHK